MPAKIKKRGENSYLLSVARGYDSKGKQIVQTKTVYASSAREAQKQYALFVAEIEQGQTSTSGKMTLAQFYDYWKESYAITIKKHQPTTLAYNENLFARIREGLGHMKLNQIEPKHLLSFYKNLAEPGIKKLQKRKSDSEKTPQKEEPLTLSSNTIRQHHSLLSSLLRKAVQWNLIPYNPAERIDAPQVTRKPKSIYTADQLGQFLQTIESQSTDKRLMVMLALACGMRREEIFGLQWKHINVENRTIKIEQASVYTPATGIIIKETKNQSSNRLITYPTFIDLLIKQHRTKQSAKKLKLGDKWQGAKSADKDSSEDFVFTQWDGKKAHPNGFYTWLRRFAIKHELAPISPHVFRHMAATFLITAGTDIRTVSGKLGHAQTSTTMNIYSHLLKTAEQGTADTMNDFLEQTTKKAKQKKQAQ